MKKSLFLLLFCYIYSNSQAQDLEDLFWKVLPSTSFTSTHIQGNTSSPNYFSARIFKITDPIWEVQTDTFYHLTKGKFTYLARDAGDYWLFNNSSEHCLKQHIETTFTLNYIKVPPYEATAYCRDTTKYMVLKVKRLVRPATITLVDTAPLPAPKTDKSSSSYYMPEEKAHYVFLKKGNWTTWKLVVCNSRPNSMMYLRLQKGLYEKGYYNGPFDLSGYEAMKRALLKYDQENNTPMCGFREKAVWEELGVYF